MLHQLYKLYITASMYSLFLTSSQRVIIILIMNIYVTSYDLLQKQLVVCHSSILAMTYVPTQANTPPRAPFCGVRFWTFI